MTTTLIEEYATVRFEPCDRFEPEADSPRCAGCGWLDHEHDIDLDR
jgi:hypothetical protein